MPRNQDTFNAEIDPLHDQIWLVNAPAFFLLVDVGFEQKSIITVALCEVAFVVLPVMLIHDL
jgi:hypothetical protein